jgi:hypothetical protein
MEHFMPTQDQGGLEIQDFDIKNRALLSKYFNAKSLSQ